MKLINANRVMKRFVLDKNTAKGQKGNFFLLSYLYGSFAKYVSHLVLLYSIILFISMSIYLQSFNSIFCSHNHYFDLPLYLLSGELFYPRIKSFVPGLETSCN